MLGGRGRTCRALLHAVEVHGRYFQVAERRKDSPYTTINEAQLESELMSSLLKFADSGFLIHFSLEEVL